MGADACAAPDGLRAMALGLILAWRGVRGPLPENMRFAPGEGDGAAGKPTAPGPGIRGEDRFENGGLASGERDRARGIAPLRNGDEGKGRVENRRIGPGERDGVENEPPC